MDIRKIEQNLVGHFKYLPRLLNCEVKLAHGATIINSGLNTSMFNIVCEADLKEESIEDVIAEFKGQNFAFWLGPSSRPLNLAQILKEFGFVSETTEHAMMCDLSFLQGSSFAEELEIKLVDDERLLQDFISVLEPYDTSVRAFYERLTDLSISEKEQLFVGFKAGIPVVISILYYDGDVAGIYSLLTKEEARGNGYGSEMMRYLLTLAKEKGFAFTSLAASSDDGFRIYERLGFKALGIFECFERRA